MYYIYVCMYLLRTIYIYIYLSICLAITECMWVRLLTTVYRCMCLAIYVLNCIYFLPRKSVPVHRIQIYHGWVGRLLKSKQFLTFDQIIFI